MQEWSTLKKLIWLYAATIGKGASWAWETITGNSPLTLLLAASHALQSLTRYGLCVQSGTPTPDAPVDIVTNNGALCMVDDELPTGYKRLLGITFDGEVYYVTNYNLRGADTLRFSFKATATGRNVIGCYSGTDATDNLSFYISDGSVYLRYNGGLYRPVARTNTAYNCAISPTGVTGLSTNASWTEADFTSAAAMFIGWLDNATSPKFFGDMYGSIVVDGRANFIPVERQSDGAIGYLDGQAFLENQGTGTPISLGYDTSHYHLSVGGTHPGQNLVDLTAVTDGYYYDKDGVYTATTDARLSDFIPVKAGQKYTAYVAKLGSSFAFNVRVNLFSTDRVWLSQSATPVSQPSVIVITPTEDGYLRLSANYKGTSSTSSWADWSTLQIVRGEYTLATMPPYEPYTEIPYTPEVLTVSGKNLFDPTKVLFGYYRDRSTGNKQTSSLNFMSSDDGYIPCLPNTAYTFVGTNKTDGTYSKYNTIYFFDSAKNYLGASPYEISQPTTGTTPSNCYYLQIRSNPLDTGTVTIQEAFQRFNWQLELGSTATDYEPYNAQTASVPMLLSVGDVKDEGELVGGALTHKVGVYVFDGTETIGKVTNASAPLGYYFSVDYVGDAHIAGGTNMRVPAFCTHFVDVANNASYMADGTFTVGRQAQRLYMATSAASTEDEYKALLAAQYAAGTPVIVLYPLATETTEQTTPQHLVTHKGTNVVEAQANVEPISLEVVYAKEG